MAGLVLTDQSLDAVLQYLVASLKPASRASTRANRKFREIAQELVDLIVAPPGKATPQNGVPPKS